MSVAPQRPGAGPRVPGAPDRLGAPDDAPVARGGGAIAQQHRCWLYDDVADFGRAAASFLGLGLSRDDRAQLVGPWSDAEALVLLAPLADAGEALARGALELVRLPVEASTLDPACRFDLLDHLAAQTRRACADGYRGLTVAVDATALVLDRERRTRFLAHEHAADRLMTTTPLSALCGYDHRRIGDDGYELAALHPEANHVVDFQVFAGDDGWLRLTGAVDALNVHLFEDVVQGALAGLDAPVLIDARSLQYINQRGLLCLDALAGRVVLVTDDAQLVRLSRTLQLTHLEVRIG